MAENIYGTNLPNFQGKTVRHNIQHVVPIIITNVPKVIPGKYKKVTLCCDLMHINGIGFLNAISQHIIFFTGSMIKNQKIDNIEYLIKQAHKIYL